MMMLLEQLLGLVSLVVFVTVMLGLVYVVAIYGHTPIEPKKIVAWWKGILGRKNSVAPPTKPQERPRWHKRFHDPV
jgi:hypothetical protein